MTNDETPCFRPFDRRTDETLRALEAAGQYKHLRMLESPMDASVEIRGYGRCLCFCSNNYLGLANHPEVVEAGIEGLRKYGAGTASVRFICGTFDPHEQLEAMIARYMGTESSYTFVSCWQGTEALFPTFCEAGDYILSDALNHACIIDAIRLTPVIKRGVLKGVYKHADLRDARARLEEARKNPEVTGQIWVVTDGVFSMEGDIADLPALSRLCDEFDAMLIVDDSHGHGVMGKTGRGTHEHWGMLGGSGLQHDHGGSGLQHEHGPEGRSEAPGTGLRPVHGLQSRATTNPEYGVQGRATSSRPTSIDMFTGTLGKALGGGAGGFIAGPRHATELLIQRGRPTLFSNALPVTVACSAAKAIEIVLREPQRVQRLKDNTTYARTKIREAGFNVLESPTAICPIIVHDTAKAIAMSKRLLELGVFVIGFGYPVVPEGEARLRVQISAAHTREHIDTLVGALKRL